MSAPFSSPFIYYFILHNLCFEQRHTLFYPVADKQKLIFKFLLCFFLPGLLNQFLTSIKKSFFLFKKQAKFVFIIPPSYLLTQLQQHFVAPTSQEAVGASLPRLLRLEHPIT